MSHSEEPPVISDPNILGGEPVLRGTRISAYGVAAKVRRGATIPDLLKLYPSLDEERIRQVVDWVERNPDRRPPPPPPPWRAWPVKRLA